MYAAAEDVPVEVEDRLAAALADVDDDAVVLEACGARRIRDKGEHPLRFFRTEPADVAERLDVALRDHEQMRRCLGRDVANRDEALGRRNVLAFAVEPAEDAVVRQRGSPPP